jgi:hypothetical protein
MEWYIGDNPLLVVYMKSRSSKDIWIFPKQFKRMTSGTIEKQYFLNNRETIFSYALRDQGMVFWHQGAYAPVSEICFF